jgi:hypothetical protein
VQLSIQQRTVLAVMPVNHLSAVVRTAVEYSATVASA